MTREEVARVIKFEKACVLRQDTPQCHRDCKKCDLLLPTDDVLTAYDMVIEALEWEPCEDAVSRQAVSEQINCWIGSGEYRYTNATYYLNKRISELQSVQHTRKRGKWVEYENGKGIECSECCVRWDFSENMTERFEFCPACGSDNREVVSK